MGYANNSYMYYRHFFQNPNATYIFTVSPFMGNPTLIITVSSTPVYPQMSNYSSYNFISQSPNSATSNITQLNLTTSMRQSADPICQKSAYYLNGGNTQCTAYIGVYCPGLCAYNLTILMDTSGQNISIPKYLIEQQYY